MTMFLARFLAIISIIYCNEIGAANILAIFPFPSKSHYNLGQVVFTELANRGHKITVISPIVARHKHENITEIRLEGVKEHLHELGLDIRTYIARGDQSVVEGLINLIYETTALVNYTLGYPKLRELISTGLKFDLLIIDMFFTDGLLGLAYHWKIPVVAISSAGTNKWTNEMVGNPHNPAYNPSIFLGYTERMTLKERLINALGSAFEKITYNYMYLPSQESIYKRYIETSTRQGEPPPPLIDLIHNVSLVLLNSHSAIQYPRPYVPNMIQVGGMHINRSLEELPKTINEFMDAAPDGVIYISLDSSSESSDLSLDKISAFVNVFAEYMGKLRIIWKWENVTLINHPNNVVIGPWLPQQAILAHPNVRLFITHGGLVSLMEAIYFAVPVIGVPIYGEQIYNIDQAEDYGFAKKLDTNNITETTVKEILNEVLTNQTFSQKAIQISKLFRDNPIDPLENAIYNIEYVLRTHGARHLRSAAVDLSLWKQNLIDVSLIIAAGISFMLAVPSFIICIVLRKNNSDKPNNKLPLKPNKKKHQ